MKNLRKRHKQSNATVTVIALCLLCLFSFGIKGSDAAVLFEDNFNDGNFDGWTVSTGTWAVENGQLSGIGAGGSIDAWIYSGDESWTDYVFEGKVTFVSGNAEFVFRSTGHWQNEYRIGFWPQDAIFAPNNFGFMKYKQGKLTYFYDTQPSPIEITNPAYVRIEIRGDTFKFFINGQPIFKYQDVDPLPNGKIGLGVVWDLHSHFDDIKVTSIDPEIDWKTLYEQCQADLNECLNPPTKIELSTLEAIPLHDQVILKWKTESETDNAGFNIWRADGFVKVNESLIPAIGSPTAGSEYDFVDQWVLNGKRYFYLLEDIDNNGISTFHGPVSATPRWIYKIGE